MQTLNQAQLNILKLFQVIHSEKDLEELRKVLIQFLAKRTVQEADKAYDEKSYTEEILESWKHEHYRIGHK